MNRMLWKDLKVGSLLAVLTLLATPGCDIDTGLGDIFPRPDATDDLDADDLENDGDLEADLEDALDLADESDSSDVLGDSLTDAIESDLTDPGVLRVTFDPDGDDFYRMPWPSDWRRQPDGHLDMSNFYEFSTPPVLRRLLSFCETELTGFATMPVVYLEVDQAPSQSALPAPAQTLQASSTIQLIDLSDANCGERVPVIVAFDEVGNTFRPPNVLMATPVPGFSLMPDRTYGFVVLRSFGAEGDQETAVPARMADILAGTDADTTLQAVYEPLLDCLPDAGVLPADIAVATVFTTQDPVSECRAVRDHVVDPTRVTAPVITALARHDGASREDHWDSYVGTYDTPIYQDGVSPYATEGGGFVFDDSQQPIIQRWEEVPFVVSIPVDYTAPVPVVIWSDGTGASLFHHLGESPARQIIAAGFAVVSFDPQFHGDRAPPIVDVDLHSFNPANPYSGRTVFRQQVIDTSYLIRVIREAFPSSQLLPAFDTSRLVYASHSQGSLVGAIAASVEPEIDSFMLNGIGSYISATVVERQKPFPLAETVQALLGISDTIDVFHPAVQLIQMIAEPVDSHNYAREWRGWPAHESGSHVYIINGPNDHTTPKRDIEMLTIVADLAPIDPPGWDVDPYGVWDRRSEALPIQGNRTAVDGSPLTMASFLAVESGHYTIYDVEEARDLAIAFITSTLTGVPRLY